MDRMHADATSGGAGVDVASLYRTVFERSADAIGIIAPDGTYVEHNEAHARLTGWPAAELAGRTPAVHLGEETFAMVLRRLRTDGYFFGEVTSRNRAGTERIVELSAFPVHGPDGAVLAYVGAKRDLSARRASETELRRQFSQLQAMYRMTAALAGAPGLDAISREALDGLCNALQASRAAILLVDETGAMQFTAWRGLSDEYRAGVGGHNPWPAGVEPRTSVSGDVTTDNSLGDLQDTVLAEGIGALAAVPLVHQGVLMGKLMVYFDTPWEPRDEEIRLAESIASHVAVAIARRQDEEELRRREQVFQTLAESSPDIIARFDRNLRHLYVNPAVEAAAGMPRDQLIGRSNRELGMPEEQVKQWEWELRHVLQTGEEVTNEFFYDTPGGRRWYSSRICPEVVEDGVILSVLATTRDITPLKRAEQRQRLLADVGAALVAHLDYRDGLADVARLLCGEFAAGCTIDLTDEDGRLERVASHPNEPGAGPDVDAVLDVALVARGRRIGVIALAPRPGQPVFSDEDAAFAGELAGRIALAVDNLRLYQASLAANRTKTDFMATMSHELRTPLNAIMGYTDLLDMGVDGQLSARQSQQLDRIRVGTRHLLTVIEEILTFSRVEAGREELQPEIVDAVELVRDAMAMVEAGARQKGLELVVDVPSRSVTMHADPVRLRQIMLNLVGNAIKFTDEGSVSVSLVTMDDDDPANGRVRFSVTDTGCGIEAGHAERIFEAFWQVRSGNTRRLGGTGLGLTVCRQLAMLMGGAVTMESEPGQGSTFTLDIPRRTP